MTFKTLAASLGKRGPTLARDLVGLTGAGSVSFGAWMIYPPAGFIVGGLMLMTGAFLTAKAGR